MDAPLAGILIRLDHAENYGDMVAEVAAMGGTVRQELNGLIENQSLQEEDEWEVFKSRKQTIVTRAAEALDRIDGTVSNRNLPQARSSPLHADETIAALLRDNPHRLTSDPSGVLTYLRSYERSIQDYGPHDPDTDFLLACVLLRLDRSEHHDQLLAAVRRLGILAFSALHNIFENVPEHDVKRHGILMPARRLWTHMLDEMRTRNQRGKSDSFASGSTAEALTGEEPDSTVTDESNGADGGEGATGERR